MSPRIVTITLNPALDVSMTVDEVIADHKMRALDTRREPGGGGVNVARVLHRLDDDVVCFLTAGGPIGNELLGLLTKEGIQVETHPIAGETRESLALRCLATGHEYKVGVEGPTVDNVAGLRESIFECVDNADAVVLSGRYLPGLPETFAADLVASLPKIVTAVDAIGRSLLHVLHGSATIVKPSARELGEVLGRRLDTVEAVEAGAREALAWGDVGALVVSLGDAGAVVVPRDEPATLLAAPPLPGPIQSTVGAGDSMVAGIVHRLLQGSSITDAAAFGVATGSAAVLSPGSELCDVEVARRLERDVVRRELTLAT